MDQLKRRIAELEAASRRPQEEENWKPKGEIAPQVLTQCGKRD